jgi:hypothetical protein
LQSLAGVPPGHFSPHTKNLGGGERVSTFLKIKTVKLAVFTVSFLYVLENLCCE